MINIKSSIQTIFRYCRISYQACTTFEDNLFQGLQSNQRIIFQETDGNRVNCFFVSSRLLPSILDRENIFGVFGIGRTDSDYKYQYASIEEMVNYYSLMNKHITVYFGSPGMIAFGKDVDFDNSIDMNGYAITDTSKYSFLVESLDLGSSKNDLQGLKIISDLKFELNSNERYSTIDANTLEKMVSLVAEILRENGLENIITQQDSRSLVITTEKINDVNGLFKFLIRDTLGQDFPIKNLFIPTANIYFKTDEPAVNKSSYALMFKPGSGKEFILGNGFLHNRILYIRPDNFMISRETVIDQDLDKLPIVPTMLGWSVVYYLITSTMVLVVFFKACQGCVKTLGQIK